MLLAPTDLLAQQHFSALQELLSSLSGAVEDDPELLGHGSLHPSTVKGLRAVLVTGSSCPAGSAARAAEEALSTGTAQLAVGTHALVRMSSGELGGSHRRGVFGSSVLVVVVVVEHFDAARIRTSRTLRVV